MATIELVLSDPQSLDDELSLFFELADTPIARRYHKALRESVRLAINSADRFYNFPNSPFNRATLAERINQCVDAVNAYAPGVIPLRAEPQMSQERLNRLHHYFEILRGPVLAPPEFMQRAPLNVKLALEHLNLTIHHFEDYERNEAAIQSGKTPASAIVLTFERRGRHALEDDDYQYFTRRSVFGAWHINYCEVGKPLWDVYQDRDDVIGDANIRPLRYYSADALVSFGATTTDAEYADTMSGFSSWWDDNQAKLRNLGYEKGDPKNAIGAIPVAQLVMDRGAVAGRSQDEIRALIGKHQYASRVLCHEDEGPTGARAIFETRIPERLQRRPEIASRVNGSYQFHITGEGGGNWFVDLTKGDRGRVSPGTIDAPTIVITMQADDLRALAQGTLSTQIAIIQKKLQFEGPLRLVLELRQLLG